MKQTLFKKLTTLVLAALFAVASIAPAYAAAGFSTALRTARADAITSAVGSAGTLTIYSGTQPATCGTATTVLVTFTMGSPFAAGATNGVLTVTLPSATAASATGTASWARIKTSGGTCVFDMAVGTASTPLILNSLSITSGVNVSVTSFVITEGNQ